MTLELKLSDTNRDVSLDVITKFRNALENESDSNNKLIVIKLLLKFVEDWLPKVRETIKQYEDLLMDSPTLKKLVKLEKILVSYQVMFSSLLKQRDMNVN